MTPPPERDNRDTFDLKGAMTDELESRNVIDYEITESSPEHVLVDVTERAEEGGSREVLYRIQHEPKLDGTDDIHWESLGPVVDEDLE